MNFNKLLAWNLHQPIAKRIHAMTLQSKCESHGKSLGMFFDIHREVDKDLQKLHEQDEKTERIFSVVGSRGMGERLFYEEQEKEVKAITSKRAGRGKQKIFVLKNSAGEFLSEFLDFTSDIWKAKLVPESQLENFTEYTPVLLADN